MIRDTRGLHKQDVGSRKAKRQGAFFCPVSSTHTYNKCPTHASQNKSRRGSACRTLQSCVLP